MRDKINKRTYFVGNKTLKNVKMFEDFKANEGVMRNAGVVAAHYKWGKYNEDVPMAGGLPHGLEELDADDLEGFDIRPEDEGKTFYAMPIDIDREGEGGTGIKHAYAIDRTNESNGPSVYNKMLDESLPLHDSPELMKEAHELAKKHNWEPDEVLALCYKMMVEINYHDMAKEFVELVKKHG